MKKSSVTYFLSILFTITLTNLLAFSSNDNSSKSLNNTPTDQTTRNEVNSSTSSYFFPQTQRNPFLSPMDYETIKKIEEEKRKKEELLKKLTEEQKNPKRIERQDEEDFLKNIKLQGIVGKYAIINGDMVEEGSYYKKKILVEKVYSSYVIVNYKGKKYKLVIK